MTYKKKYAYNYGFLSSATKQAVKELELLIQQSRGKNKETLKNIHRELNRSLTVTETNLLPEK